MSSSESENEGMEEDEEELTIIQKNMETIRGEENKRERTSDEETETIKTRMKSTPHPRGKGQRQLELPETSDSSDEDRNQEGNKDKPCTSLQARATLCIPTPNLNKTIVPKTPTRWNQMIEQDQEMEDNTTGQSIAETPCQENKKQNAKSYNRNNHE